VRFLRSKRGDIFAYFGVIMVFLMVPLSSLAIDIVRGMYVRGHLQTANDAACQAAADALDAPLFIQTGEKRIRPSLARSQAAQAFNATLVDASQIRFSPALQVQIVAPLRAHCSASASVARLIPGTPDMNVSTFTESEMRVSRLN
jgi:hypothetical protein